MDAPLPKGSQRQILTPVTATGQPSQPPDTDTAIITAVCAMVEPQEKQSSPVTSGRTDDQQNSLSYDTLSQRPDQQGIDHDHPQTHQSTPRPAAADGRKDF
ncbi:hypothetical protein AYO21_11712 [Fonsecaea monophora]|uniref:Uncharacterized protein n=1 Tax=Fonsecaea monophora TaxID=254056 RepID=A0A177ESU6_9EURO|nr:hypothetical protein AYO21_11712 [Fonsecaea monophora]KAH0829848.1 hypothetical protein FOPE_10904 [Fonsecaea pedrosoi]OAG34132.1 hypothetical protein AYO21_11712 [Fonsecaea monophora]